MKIRWVTAAMVPALVAGVVAQTPVNEDVARRQRDGAECFRLVGLAVSEERPDLRIRLLLQASVLEVAHEPRLIDRHDRAEAHRDRRVFPEVRHQPGMRV